MKMYFLDRLSLAYTLKVSSLSWKTRVSVFAGVPRVCLKIL
jgi:hypothetical protein